MGFILTLSNKFYKSHTEIDLIQNKR